MGRRMLRGECGSIYICHHDQVKSFLCVVILEHSPFPTTSGSVVVFYGQGMHDLLG
jgi:hypothetical protein